MLRTTLKNRGKINYLILIILILNSCTIEKRLHQKGYHVEWRNNLKNEVSTGSSSSVKSERLKVIDQENFDLATSDSVNIIEEKKIITLNSPEVNQPKTVLSKKEIKTIKKFTGKVTFLKLKKKREKEKKAQYGDDMHNEIYEPFAIVGFICSLLAIVLPILLLSEFAILLMILFGLFALIFSIIALIKIRKNNKFGKGFAIFGLVVGILAIIIFPILLFLLILLVFSGF